MSACLARLKVRRWAYREGHQLADVRSGMPDPVEKAGDNPLCFRLHATGVYRYMRAFDGQRSDRLPIKRNDSDKQAQLQALKARLATMKSHESAALRASVESKIAELEAELGSARRR